MSASVYLDDCSRRSRANFILDIQKCMGRALYLVSNWKPTARIVPPIFGAVVEQEPDPKDQTSANSQLEPDRLNRLLHPAASFSRYIPRDSAILEYSGPDNRRQDNVIL